MTEENKTQEPKPQAPPSSAPAELRKIEKEFERQVKVTKARPVFARIFWISWAVLDIVLVVIFVGVIAFYLVSGSFVDRVHVAALTQNLNSLHNVTIENAAQPILAGDVRTFSLGESRYDLFIELENPNDDWWVEVSYYFEDDGEASETSYGFLLPSEKKPLVALYQLFSARPSGAEFIVEDLSWHRVDRHEVADIEDWLADHGFFTVENAEYSTDIEIEGTDLARSSFTVTNQTPYNFWEAEFLVVLKSASGNVLGVNQVTIPGFESSEQRDVNVNWFGDAPSGSSEVNVDVITDINFFDEDEYMPLSADVEGDIRDSVRFY